MEVLELKSKTNLGCNMCDKCCIYRGDIRLTPVNVYKISKYLKIDIKTFLENYTDKLENQEPELVLKTTGDKKQCILYDNKNKKCGIHSVKPMQCVMFPLVPVDLKNDKFYNSQQCVLKNPEKITVDKWINGNNKIYSKNKEICMEWISFIEWIQYMWRYVKEKDKNTIYKVLFENYHKYEINIKSKVRKNMKRVYKLVMENMKQSVDIKEEK